MESFDDRMTHIYFPQKPADAAITTEAKTRTSSGSSPDGVYRGLRKNTRTGLIVRSPQFDTLLTVIFTLKEGEAEPVVTVEDGALVVEHSGVRDTIRFTADGVEVQ